MMENRAEFVQFLMKAKRATYAGDGAPVQPWRPQSHDLPFRDGSYLYIDTYLGGIDFAGEEAVWNAGVPLWSMNYYGRMLVEPIPDGFNRCLKEALLRVAPEAPFRGPEQFTDGPFEYHCRWDVGLEFFIGREEILLDGRVIYELIFHGGRIR